MTFVTLSKWKKAPTKEMQTRLNQATRSLEDLEKYGINMRVYWILGRYDGVTIIEVPLKKIP